MEQAKDEGVDGAPLESTLKRIGTMEEKMRGCPRVGRSDRAVECRSDRAVERARETRGTDWAAEFEEAESEIDREAGANPTSASGRRWR